MSQKIYLVFAMVLNLLSISAMAQASSARPSIANLSTANLSTMINDEIAMLTFIGGGTPLSERERQQAVQIVQAAMQSEPQQWIKADQNARTILAKLATHDPVYTANIREILRTNTAFPSAKNFESQMENAIISAHDPVVTTDPVHRLIVTEQTLLAAQHDSTFVAAQLGVPPPASNFLSTERSRVHAMFGKWDMKARDAYAHAGRNGAATEIYLTRFINRQKIAAYFTQTRQQILSRPSESVALTDYAVIQLAPAGYTLYERHMSRGNAAEELQLRWMGAKGMQQAVMCPPGKTSGLCNPLP